jgi:hypothetical protein
MWALQNPRTKVITADINYKVMPGLALGGRPAIEELKAGASEIGGNNKGKWVKKYLQPTGLAEGNSILPEQAYL